MYYLRPSLHHGTCIYGIWEMTAHGIRWVMAMADRRMAKMVVDKLNRGDFTYVHETARTRTVSDDGSASESGATTFE